MAADEVPLHGAPDRFFERTAWDELVRLFGGRDAALQQISRLEPGAITRIRQQVATLTGSTGEKARAEEHRAQVGYALATRFRRQLISGEIIATGLSHLAIDRVKIPAERWDELWPNFVTDTAEGPTLKIVRVRVFRSIDDKPASTGLLTECIAWMRERGAAGETRRKVLEGESRQRFPSLKVREFAAAYRSVFEKQRGRPRRTTSE